MPGFLHYYAPVLLWGAVILLMSGTEFQAESTLRWLRSLLELVFPDVSIFSPKILNAVVRKLAHVTEYFILGLLVWRAVRRGAAPLWRRQWALGTLAVGVLWASADETYQFFRPGRTGSVLDVGYDTLGVLLALLLVYGWGRRSARSQSASFSPR